MYLKLALKVLVRQRSAKENTSFVRWNRGKDKKELRLTEARKKKGNASANRRGVEGLGGRGTVASVQSASLHDGQRIEERERVMSGEGVTHSGEGVTHSGEGVTHSGEGSVREGLVRSLISFLFSCKLPHLILLAASTEPANRLDSNWQRRRCTSSRVTQE